MKSEKLSWSLLHPLSFICTCFFCCEQAIAAVHLGSQSVLGPMISEEKIVFGVVANVERVTCMQQLGKEISAVDLKGVCFSLHTVCMCVEFTLRDFFMSSFYCIRILCTLLSM